ncbi:hypothetical protein BN2364_4055 [Alloalcanivorax xenomutans]|nr:hypothetical protein BN2364_4055 [Alloalcanivorax xenomutans]
MARWSDMTDGTYTLEDVKEMHSVLDEVAYQNRQVTNG